MRLRSPVEAGADTLPNRIWFGLGQGGHGVANTAMGLLLFFYSQVLGLDPRLAGLALLLSMISDGIGKPAIWRISAALTPHRPIDTWLKERSDRRAFARKMYLLIPVDVTEERSAEIRPRTTLPDQ